MQEAFLTAVMVAAVSAFSMMVTASLAFLVMVMIAGSLRIITETSL